MKRNPLGAITSATCSALLIGLLVLTSADPCSAQALPPVRGVYTPGFNATNSGVMPEPGLTYANYFLDYSFDQFVTARGDNIFEQGNAAVFMDVNVFEWVFKKKIFGGNYAVAAGLPQPVLGEQPVDHQQRFLAGRGDKALGGVRRVEQARLFQIRPHVPDRGGRQIEAATARERA